MASAGILAPESSRRPRSAVNRKAGRWIGAIALRSVLAMTLVAAWQIATLVADALFFPTPVEIASRFVEKWLSGPASSLLLTESAMTNVLPSLGRMVGGWALAAVLGVLLGSALGLSRRLAAYVDPLIAFARAIPPPVLLPVYLVALGANDRMRIALIATGAVWPVLVNTVAGVRSVHPTQLDTAIALGLSPGRRFTGVVLPAALPSIFAGLRVSLSLALILMVISELVASTGGIGFELIQAQRSFAVVDLWAGIVLLALLGYLLNTLLMAVESKWLAWHREARAG